MRIENMFSIFSHDQIGQQTGPARLVAGPQGAPVVAVEVLVEEDEVPEVGVLGVARVVAVARPVAVGAGQEERGQPGRDLA